MVTTIEYKEDTREYTSVFVPHPANPGGMYPMKDSNESDTGEATKLPTLLKINFVPIQNIIDILSALDDFVVYAWY